MAAGRRASGAAAALALIFAGCGHSSDAQPNGADETSSTTALEVSDASTPTSIDTACLASAMSTLEMNECAAFEREQLEAAIGEALDSLRTQVGPSHVQEVDDAQAAWLNYVEVTCEVAGLAAEGGSLRGPITSFCAVDLAEARLSELQRALQAFHE